MIIDIYPALQHQLYQTISAALASGFVASLLWRLRA